MSVPALWILDQVQYDGPGLCGMTGRDDAGASLGGTHMDGYGWVWIVCPTLPPLWIADQVRNDVGIVA